MNSFKPLEKSFNSNQSFASFVPSQQSKSRDRITKGFYVEYSLIVVLVFCGSLAFYLSHWDLINIILGIILSLIMTCLILVYFIAEKLNYRHYKNIFFPGLFFLTGLCIIFQDPDIIRNFTEISSDPSYLPSNLTLILLLFTVGTKGETHTNITFACLILGILSFCLTISQHETIGRSVFLLVILIFVILNNAKTQYLKKKKISNLAYDEIFEEKDADMEFEDITNKLQVTTGILAEILSNPEGSSEGIKQSLLNLKAISQCLQVKNNIYSVKINSVTKNMDEQDRMFIEESCFDGQTKINENSNAHAIKFQHEYSGGITELMGLLKSIGKDWNFNTFFLKDCCNNTPVQVVGLYAFTNFGLDELFKVPTQVIKDFLFALEDTYLPNPYHNSVHAADVMSSYLYLLCNSKFVDSVSSLDMMAGVIASLGHDAGHPAKNNRFLVLTKDDIAIQYNDISVLEMLHTSTIFKIMKNGTCNIFKNLGSEQWLLARKLIIEMVLATDMSKHFDLLGQFRGKYKASDDFAMNNPDMKLELFRLIIKAADIGHAAKNIELHEKWCKLVVEEFYSQGDLEKSMGLTVSMYCDRETTDISKSQAGFIKNIVSPLFNAINFILDSEIIQENCVEQLKINEEFWIRRRKNIRGKSVIMKDSEYFNHLNNLYIARSNKRKPSLPDKYLS